MTYLGWRCLTGDRSGNVDFLGEIEADSIRDAEEYFRDTFDFSIDEYLDVEEYAE